MPEGTDSWRRGQKLEGRGEAQGLTGVVQGLPDCRADAASGKGGLLALHQPEFRRRARSSNPRD